MIFVDTNYFLRYLLEDNKEQAEKVKKLFYAGAAGKEKLITSIIVYFEIYWVLSSYYQKKKTDLIKTFRSLLALEFIHLEERLILSKSIELFSESNLSLEDCYNLSLAKFKKCTKFATFDQKLKKYF